MGLISKFFYYRPRLEAAVSQLDNNRLRLPLLSLDRLFPESGSTPIVLHELPQGPWSTPLIDVAVLLKIAVCAKPRTVMEIGSYRGYTALALARQLDPACRIVTVDADPRHGEAYRQGPYASRIERRICRTEPAGFADDAPGSIDLLFIDADHTYAGVKNDTELLLNLVSPDGFVVWHDYVNSGKFSRKNGVPEYLNELGRGIPIAHIAGSWLAIHSPAWASGAGAASFKAALTNDDQVPYSDPWVSVVTRG